MNDVILSLDDFNKIFQRSVISALGMAENAVAWKAWNDAGRNGNEPLNPFYNVRISWPTVGAPAWKITEDICFIQCVEIDDLINKQRDTEFQNIDDLTANKETGYTRVFAISFVLYGPNSYNNSRKIKDSLFSETNRMLLAISNLFMIPNFKAATRLPELFQGQYWERTDLTINFNNLVSVNEVINYIRSAGVNVKNDTTIEQSITIAT